MLFRNSIRFSLVHDKPPNRFKHARSLFLHTNAFFIQNKKNLCVKIKIMIFYWLDKTTPIFKGGFLHFEGHLMRQNIRQINLKVNPSPGQFL